MSALARPFGRIVTEIAGVALVAGGMFAFVDRFSTSSWAWILVVAAVAVYVGVAALDIRLRVSVSRRLDAYLIVTAVVLSDLLVIAFAYRVFDGVGPLAAGFAVVLGSISMIAGIAALLWRTGRVAVVLGPRMAALPRAAILTARSAWSYPWLLLALTILWLPTLVALAPGSTTYDGTRQINEWIGSSIPALDFTYTPMNHHPWFATVWQGSLLSAGLTISGGDINAGLLFHSVVLAVASLLTYAWVVQRIQRVTNRGWTVAAVVFFGVLPHFSNYAMLYEKTGWYQLALIWFFLGVIDVALRRGNAVTQLLQLAIGGALTALFRSNGIYVVLASLLVIAAVSLTRTERRRLMLAAGSAVVVAAVFFGWTNVALPRLGVAPASPGEALVVPFQQVARIVAEHGDELTAEQRAAIDAVMPYDHVAAAYDPENGDGVKGLYEIDSFLITDVGIRKMQARGEWEDDPTVAADRSAFLATWAELVREYPATAISATVHNTYLYYAPPLNRGDDISTFTGGLPDYVILANPYTDDYRHLAGEQPSTFLTGYYSVWAKTPGLNMLVNPGLYGWIVIALAIGWCFWPSRARLMLLAPVLLVYVINFAGARNGDFRYTVPLVALVPLCLAAWFVVNRRRVDQDDPQAVRR